jgi:predicted PurR-regulated permease PerM
MTQIPYPPLVAPGLGSRGAVRTLVVLLATTLGVFFCYRMAAPFLDAIVWALALAVLCAPVQCWLELRFRRPTVVAIINVLIASLIVGAAITFVGQHLLYQAAKGAEAIDASVGSGDWRSVLAGQPRLTALADWIEHQFDLPGTAQALATGLSGTARSFLMGSLVQAITFFLTFYLLFYFLRDRETVCMSLRSLSPLREDETVALFVKIRDTIYATVYGTIAVASVQGFLSGLMFWWLGLTAPLLWGLVMALLSVVPVAGSFVVWIPAAIYLALDGSWGKAAILTLWGAIVVSTIDNILHPILVGNRLKIHTVLVFVSVVGGLIVFGAIGLILGPVVLTITLALIESWRGRSATVISE